MQIWDLKALFANEKECEQNALNLQKECEKFKDKYLEKYENLTILRDDLFDEVSTQENSQGIIFLYSLAQSTT